jgi:signal transduction histidine kinase
MLTLNSQQTRRYTAADLDLAAALMQQLTLALQLARLGDTRREAAVLDERNRLAREIHDTLAQGFTGIVIQLEAAEDTLADDPAAARAHLDRARGLARSSLAEARRSVQALRPLALEETDLVHALARVADTLTAGTSTRAEVHVYGSPRRLPPDVEQDLLRIGQEALTNALRYAAATHISIGLTFAAGSVALRVADDGGGFDPAAPPQGGGFGLVGMGERLARHAGTLTLDTRPGGGTTVVAEIPVREV